MKCGLSCSARRVHNESPTAARDSSQARAWEGAPRRQRAASVCRTALTMRTRAAYCRLEPDYSAVARSYPGAIVCALAPSRPTPGCVGARLSSKPWCFRLSARLRHRVRCEASSVCSRGMSSVVNTQLSSQTVPAVCHHARTARNSRLSSYRVNAFYINE